MYLLAGMVFLFIITLSNPVSAQRLMDANRSTIGYIEEGRVLNEYRSTIGYFEKGRVLNSNRATLEYFEDGRVLNSGERIPRRLCRGVSEQRNEEVLDGIGFLEGSAARSFNAYRETIGYYEEVILEDAALFFFFFFGG